MINNSFSRNGKGFILMFLSALCACLGQLFWKFFVLDGDYILLLLGCFLYCVGALLMLIAYKHGSLSVLQPILSVSYVFSLLIGYFFLNETICLLNWIGCFCIIGGVIFIAGGD